MKSLGGARAGWPRVLLQGMLTAAWRMLQRKERATRYGGLTEAVGAQPAVEGQSTFLLPFPHPAPGRWTALVPVLVV